MFSFCSMTSQPEKRARAEAMLGEIAELALMVTRELAMRVRESEDVNQTVALADAFQKVSRVVRLTLARDFKLGRARRPRPPPPATPTPPLTPRPPPPVGRGDRGTGGRGPTAAQHSGPEHPQWKRRKQPSSAPDRCAGA